MALGNKGLAGMIVGAGEGAAEARRPPRTGFLESRENRLAEVARGTTLTRIHEAVDPALCRIWEGHNRDYQALDESICADLLGSLRAQGRQEVPAIVRRVKGDPVVQYEVICGARRHWSVTWLRAHDYPEFKFLVEARELTDEEAFRLADLENRSRRDLSDYERAIDYARAIERYYGGSQQRMADRLNVTKSWLSRFLELAKLPPEILDCFGSPHRIGISHAASLAPILGHARDRHRLLQAAAGLAAEQHKRIEAGAALIPPVQIVARLCAARDKRDPAATRPGEILDDQGKLLLTVAEAAGGGLTFTVPKARLGDRQRVLQAVERCLAAHAPGR